MSARGALALAALCIVAAAAGFTAYRAWQAAQQPDTVAELRDQLEFTGLDGSRHRLSGWDGKLLILNFWATWCAPCLKEIPLLVKAQDHYGPRGLQIVGLALDTPDAVRPFSERYRMNYPIMVGEADVIAAMDRLGDTLGALPFSVVIAPDGRIVERIYGDLSAEELQELLDAHLPD